jgi:hypothetical protein
MIDPNPNDIAVQFDDVYLVKHRMPCLGWVRKNVYLLSSHTSSSYVVSIKPVLMTPFIRCNRNQSIPEISTVQGLGLVL